jgi:hypothetical protein
MTSSRVGERTEANNYKRERWRKFSSTRLNLYIKKHPKASYFFLFKRCYVINKVTPLQLII